MNEMNILSGRAKREGAATIGRMTFGMMTLSVATLGIAILSIATLNIRINNVQYKLNDTQQYGDNKHKLYSA